MIVSLVKQISHEGPNIMKNIISTVSVAALFAMTSLAGIVPAAAAGPVRPSFQQQDRYIGSYCDRNPSARQCNDWRRNRTHWSRSQYQGFYRDHQNDRGFGSNFAAGLFGFAVGAAMTGALGNTSSHVRACQSRYRSYNMRTDTFLGYDGIHHACRL